MSKSPESRSSLPAHCRRSGQPTCPLAHGAAGRASRPAVHGTPHGGSLTAAAPQRSACRPAAPAATAGQPGGETGRAAACTLHLTGQLTAAARHDGECRADWASLRPQNSGGEHRELKREWQPEWHASRIPPFAPPLQVHEQLLCHRCNRADSSYRGTPTPRSLYTK